MSKRNALPNLEPAIARLRQIAAEAGDHFLLADGPVHPDAKLLELCAEIAERRLVAERQIDDLDVQAHKYYYLKDSPLRPKLLAIRDEQKVIRFGISQLLRRAGKLRAMTASGIYGKAIAIRASQTGAAMLARSLAEDLISNPTLRASLWTADAATSASAAGKETLA